MSPLLLLTEGDIHMFLFSFLLFFSRSVNANYQLKSQIYEMKQADVEEIQLLMLTKDVANIIQCQDM